MTYFNSNNAMHFNEVRYPGAMNLVKMLTNAIPCPGSSMTSCGIMSQYS